MSIFLIPLQTPRLWSRAIIASGALAQLSSSHRTQTLIIWHHFFQVLVDWLCWTELFCTCTLSKTQICFHALFKRAVSNCDSFHKKNWSLSMGRLQCLSFGAVCQRHCVSLSACLWVLAIDFSHRMSPDHFYGLTAEQTLHWPIYLLVFGDRWTDARTE